MYEIGYLSGELPLPVEDIVEYVSGAGTFIQLFDVSALISEEQLEFAASRIDKISEHTRIKSRELILLCLVSGEHQINNAISRAGIKPETIKIACLYEDKSALEGLVRRFTCLRTSKERLLPRTAPDRDRELFGKMVQSQLRLVS